MTDTQESPAPDEEPLTFEAVLAEFDKAGPSDILYLREHEADEMARILLDAIDSGKFVYRTTYTGGWTTMILSTHGHIVVTRDKHGTIKFHVPSPNIGSGTVDLGAQILKVQKDYREEGKDRRLETGQQFGRWFL